MEKIRFREREQGKTLEVEVYYSLGGINYFDGNIKRRGIYVSITPMEINGGFKSFTLLGENSGMCLCLEELKRGNSNKVVIWSERIKPLLSEIYAMANAQGVRSGLTLIKDKLGVTLN